MSREAHVRFCEGPRVKLPRSTHPYIPTGEGWLYLAGIKDVFTCEIVGYSMAERMTLELTSRALFRAAQQKRPAAGLIHHSDRGSQYCAHDYRKILDQFGMKASMSRKGNCYDNAPMESFWGSLKNELVHHCRYATRAEAEASIREYIEIFYNRQRRHSRLGYLIAGRFLTISQLSVSGRLRCECLLLTGHVTSSWPALGIASVLNPQFIHPSPQGRCFDFQYWPFLLSLLRLAVIPSTLSPVGFTEENHE